MKNKNRISKCIGIIALLYLVVDVFHYYIYRFGYVDNILVSAYYESKIISFLKWSLCISIIVGHIFDKKEKQISFYLMLIPAIGILILFILKGQFIYLLKGSFVFISCLLELLAILIILYSLFFLVKKYKIGKMNCIITIMVSVIILGLIFYQLPVIDLPKGW